MDYSRNQYLEKKLDRILNPTNWNNKFIEKYEDGVKVKVFKWKDEVKKNKILPSQIESLKDYNKYLTANNVKLVTRATRINQYLQPLMLMIKKDPKKITKKDLQEFLIKHPQRNFKTSVKYYLKWLYGFEERGEYPDIVKWIRLPKTEFPNIETKECLTYDEIKKMISVSKSIRDKCIISILYDGGMRASELLNIKIKDVEMEERNAIVRVETGKIKNSNPRFRPILLVDSYFYLQLWLREHPFKDNPESYLFINYNHTHDNKQLGYSGLNHIVSSLGKKAGITKKFNIHFFRHSAVKNTEGDLSDSEQRVRYGWEAGSRMIARYSGITGEDVIDKQKNQKGLVEEDKTKIKKKDNSKPVWKECPRCLQSNNLNINNWCSRCGAGLTIAALNQKEEIEQQVGRDIVKELMNNPTYADQLQKQIEVMVKERINKKSV